MSYRVEAILSAVDSGFTSKFNQATKAVEKLQNQAGKVSSVASKIGSATESIGRSLTTKLTVPIAAAFAFSGKKFMEFEDGLVGVGKTTGLAGKDLNKFGEEIKKMSSKIPSSSKELLDLSQTAGQLGVHGQKDLLSFTEVMAEMGSATNLAGEQGARSMAQFMNIMGQEVGPNIRNVGNAIVRLGNNFATSESDIMEMSTRLAASSRLVGVTTPSVLALATAMSTVGIEAEAGGTAMSQVMTKIDKAVSSGSDSLNNFANVSGMSASSFANAWKSNPTKALQALMKGLDNVGKSGGNMNQVLDDLGIKGIRESNAVKSLAQNHKILDNAIKMSNEAYEHGNDLHEEAAQASATLSSTLRMLGNTMVNIGSDIFSRLEPALSEIATKVRDFAAIWHELDDSAKKSIANIVLKVGALLAAIGPMLLIGGKITKTMAPVIGIMSQVGGAFKAASGIFTNFGSIFSSASSVIKTGLDALDNKFLEFVQVFPKMGTKAINGVNMLKRVPNIIQADVGAKIYDIFDKMDFETQEKWKSLISGISTSSSKIGSVLGSAIGKAGQVLNLFGINVGNAVKVANFAMGSLFPASVIGLALVGLGLLYSQFGDQIDKLLQVAAEKGPQIIQKLGKGITKKIPELVEKGTTLVEGFAKALAANIPMIFQQGVAIISSLVSSVGENAGRLIAAAIPVIGNFINGLLQAIPQLLMVGLQFLVQLAQGIIQNIPLILQAAVQIVQNFAQSMATNAPMIAQTGIGLVLTLAKGIITNIPAILSAAWEIVKALAKGILKALAGVAGTVIEGAKSFFKNMLSPGKEEAQTARQDVGAEIDGIGLDLNTKTATMATTAQQNAMMARTGFTNEFSLMNTDVATKLSELQASTGLTMSQIQQEIMTNGQITRDGITITAEEMKTNVSTQTSDMADNMINDVTRGVDGVNAKSGELSTQLPGDAATTNQNTSAQYEDLASRITSSTEQANSAVTNGMSTINENFEMRLGTLPAKTDEILLRVSQAFTNAFNAIGKGVDSNLNKIVTTYTNGINKLNTSTSSGLNKLSTGFTSAFNRVNATVTSGTNRIVASVNSMNNRVNSSFTAFSIRLTSTNQTMWNRFNANSTQAMNKNLVQFTSNTNKMNNIFTIFSNKFKSINSNMWSNVVNRTKQSGNSMNSAFSNACGRLRGLANNLRNNLVSIMNSSVGGMRSAGYNAGMGFYSGLASTRGAIMSLASSIAYSVSSRIRSALRIHSPSRVMMNLGSYTGEGFALGIENSKKYVSKSLDGLTNETTSLNTSLNGGYNGFNAQSRAIPLEINLRLGSNEFRAISRDITQEQGRDLRLERDFGL